MPKRFSKGYFLLYLLAHPVAIILVMEGAIYFQFSTSMEQGYRRVMNAVEHICLDHRIMNHVFKYDPLSYLQFVVKLPAANLIATQATVSSQAVDMVFPSRRFHRLSRKRFGITHPRLIRHLQPGGHVAGKAHLPNVCP